MLGNKDESMKVIGHNHISIDFIVIALFLVIKPFVDEVTVFFCGKYPLPFTNGKSNEVYLLCLKFCLISYCHAGSISQLRDGTVLFERLSRGGICKRSARWDTSSGRGKYYTLFSSTLILLSIKAAK